MIRFQVASCHTVYIIMASLLNELSSNLLNSKDITYIHPATGSRSSIDLAICDPAFPGYFLERCVCSISTILGTNGLNSADVPLSNKQTNKQTNRMITCVGVIISQ